MAAKTVSSVSALGAISDAIKERHAIVTNQRPTPGRLAVDQRVSMVITSEAKGSVLAEGFVNLVKSHDGDMKGYLVKISNLADLSGHTAFQQGIAKARKAWMTYWKGQAYKAGTANVEATPEIRPGIKAGSKMDKLAQGITRSGGTRLSEAVTFSKACAGGFKPEFEGKGFHVLVSEARAYLAAKAGKTAVAAKPPTAIEKALAYIERLDLNKRQRESLAARIEAL